MGRSKYTRYINKFEYWTVEDCSCEYCIHFTKDQPCPLDACCIEDIRQEAIWRESGASTISTSATATNNGGVSVSFGASDEVDTFGVSDGYVPDVTVGVIDIGGGKEVTLSAVD